MKAYDKVMSPEELIRLRSELWDRLDPEKPRIVVCGDTGYVRGSRELAAALEKALEQHALRDKIELKITGCLGFCEQGPLVLIFPAQSFTRKFRRRMQPR